MKQLKSFRMVILAALTIICFGCLTATAEASPIAYEFSSTAASGGIFQDAAGTIPIADLQSVGFLISIFGDTADVGADPLDPPNGLANSGPSGLGLNGTISISGTDPVTLLPLSFFGNFLDLFTVWLDRDGETIGFDDNTVAAALGVPAYTLLALYAPGAGLGTYDLASSFGPIPATTVFSFEQFASIPTSFGFVTFDTVDNATFQAPEPASMLLLSLGLLGIAGFRRRLKG